MKNEQDFWGWLQACDPDITASTRARQQKFQTKLRKNRKCVYLTRFISTFGWRIQYLLQSRPGKNSSYPMNNFNFIFWMFFSHPTSLNSTSEDLFRELVPCKDEAKVFKLISQNIAQGFDHLLTCSMKARQDVWGFKNLSYSSLTFKLKRKLQCPAFSPPRAQSIANNSCSINKCCPFGETQNQGQITEILSPLTPKGEDCRFHCA